MIRIDDYEIFSKNMSSLKELSKDDSDLENIAYMTESEKEAVDFDKVKTIYTNGIGLSEEVAKSVDALLFDEERLTFIEFKNGKMKTQKAAVKSKVRDSLLMFCDIVKTNISETREYLDLVLVYNITKNPLPNQLLKGSPQDSPSRDQIAKHFLGRAGKELIRFDIEDFQNLYFREVHTYSQDEFDKFIM